MTWVKSNHTFKFGIDFRKNQENMIFNGAGLGQFNFTTLETGLPNVAGTGNAFASFLLGQVNSGRQFINNTVFGWRYAYYAGFFQDTWKLTPKLTLNYGMRYEIPLPRGDSLGVNFQVSWKNPA